VLGLSTAALLAVGVAGFMRIRRLSQASQTQFRRAVQEEEQPGEAARVSADEQVPR